MKAIYLLAAAALAFTACTGNKEKTVTEESTMSGERTYVGVMPAADAEGIRYDLVLTYDDMNGNNDGNYSLTETYLISDSLATEGIENGNVFNSEGEFFVMTGTPASASQKYIKMVPKHDTTASEATPENLYFIVESDSTITLVNESLEPSVTPGLNYSLKLQ